MTLKRTIDKRILNSFKHIHETADNTSTKTPKLATADRRIYVCVCIYTYIYIYVYIHTNQLIRRLFVDLIPNFPNQYQKN